MIRSARFTAAVCVVVGVAVAGCAQTPPSRFYTLTSGAGEPAAVASRTPAPLSVGLGPVRLPQYLDRPQLVRRSSPNEFQLAEFDKWGEPLEDLVPRVLATDLGAQLGTERVFVLPRRRPTDVDYFVQIEVNRFDADIGGDVVLIARWEVLDRNEKPIRLAETRINEPVSGPDVADVVAAMSRALGRLSQEIALAIGVAARTS